MPRGTYADLLGNRGFVAFLVAQFLGAFNDNVCRLIRTLAADLSQRGAQTV